MNMPVEQVSRIARGAAQKKEWATVHAAAIELAATTLSNIGLHHKAWPLYLMAIELQPLADRLSAAGVKI